MKTLMIIGIVLFCMPVVGGLIEQIKLWVLIAKDKKQNNLKNF